MICFYLGKTDKRGSESRTIMIIIISGIILASLSPTIGNYYENAANKLLADGYSINKSQLSIFQYFGVGTVTFS